MVRRWRAGRVAVVLGVACWLFFAASPAHAGDDSLVVVESYVGERPSDADRLLAPLFEELGARGYVTDRAIIGAQVERELSATGAVQSDGRLAKGMALARSGYRKWEVANFQEAVKELEEAKLLLLERPSTLVELEQGREAMFKVLVGLALAHKRLANVEQAESAMAELIRTFPNREISRAAYGPEPRNLYERVKRALAAGGVGRLTIRVDEPSAVIFVNERYACTGECTLDAQLPGPYRVYVQKGRERGRVHAVTVTPNQDTSLEISWALDAALRTAGFAGFSFAIEGARAYQESRHLAAVTEAIGAQAALVVTVRVAHGRRLIEGYIYTAGGAEAHRRAAVALDDESNAAASLRALARFLAGDDDAAEYVITGTSLLPVEGERASTSTTTSGSAEPIVGQVDRRVRDDGRGLRIAGIATAGAGLAPIGLGVFFGLKAKRISDEIDRASTVDPDRYAEGEAAERNMFIAYGIGASAIVTGGILYYLGHRAAESATEPSITFAPSVTPTGIAFGAVGRF